MSDYVSTFRGEGVEPDLVALRSDYVSTFRGDECHLRASLPVQQRVVRLLGALGVFVGLALATARGRAD